MSPRPLRRPLRLLLAGAGLALAAAESSQDVAAFAARAALAGLDDVARWEAELVKLEASSVASGSAASALEVFPALQATLGGLFDSVLLVLRHTAAAADAAGIPAEELGTVASLDEQLSALLTVHAKEPLFFWHGPKAAVLSKIERLFNGEASWRSRLSALGANAKRPSPSDLLGGGAVGVKFSSLRDLVKAAAKGSVPLLGVVAGDADCGAGDGRQPPPCDIAGPLAEASRASYTPAAVNLVLTPPCGSEALSRIADALRAIEAVPEPVAVRITYILPQEVVESGARQVMRAIDRARRDLGRDALDMVAMPYVAFKKQYWAEVREVLEKALGSGSIKAYGIHTEARSATVLSKLLERSPRPAALVTPHDMLRPADEEAVAVARRLGAAALALPRLPGAPGGAAGAVYLQAAIGAKRVDQEAAHLMLALQRGMSAALFPQGASAVFKRLPTLAIDEASLGLVGALGALTKPLKLPSEAAEASTAAGLHALLQQGRKAASTAWRAAPPEAALADRKTAAAEAAPAAPSISPAMLQNLEQQRKQYQTNKNVIYVPKFFDDVTFKALLAETKRLWRSHDMEANCNLDGVNRLGGYVLDHVPRNSTLYQLVYGNEALRQWISAVNGEGEMWPADFPIELREYGPQSQGMGCHPDLQMYATEKKDCEFVITVDNDSECKVRFYDAENVMHEVHTEGNSLMMVRVNAATHCVSPTVGGTRTILKFIFTGDYRKSSEFWMYTENRCDDDNPNRKAMRQRREAPVAFSQEL